MKILPEHVREVGFALREEIKVLGDVVEGQAWGQA